MEANLDVFFVTWKVSFLNCGHLNLAFSSHALPKKISFKNKTTFIVAMHCPKYPLAAKSYFSFDVTNLYIDVAAILDIAKGGRSVL